MVDVALLFGRIVFLVALYLFLFAAVRTGVGLVRAGAPAGTAALVLAVTRGPRELAGTRVPLDGPVVIGRGPDADVRIGDEFVSARHALVAPVRGGALVEDLGSTNGTLLNGRPVTGQTAASAGDVIGLGPVELTLERA
ncbi:MAG: FHA domain-containing protein [Coriobacteriaceae bacterium]|nr:FHA domain-containing protein [Coriobacteriaceae bacterium]